MRSPPDPRNNGAGATTTPATVTSSSDATHAYRKVTRRTRDLRTWRELYGYGTTRHKCFRCCRLTVRDGDLCCGCMFVTSEEFAEGSRC